MHKLVGLYPLRCDECRHYAILVCP